ncbi:9418_t:CDS:2, partial [Acaulospora morrowiae]
ATVNIWKIFCNSGVPFKYNHIQYLSHATHEEVLGPLFKILYITSKSDHKILELDDQNEELITWLEVLSNLNDHLTNEFKHHLRAFMDKIDASQFKNNKRRPIDKSRGIVYSSIIPIGLIFMLNKTKKNFIDQKFLNIPWNNLTLIPGLTLFSKEDNKELRLFFRNQQTPATRLKNSLVLKMRSLEEKLQQAIFILLTDMPNEYTLKDGH